MRWAQAISSPTRAARRLMGLAPQTHWRLQASDQVAFRQYVLALSLLVREARAQVGLSISPACPARRGICQVGAPMIPNCPFFDLTPEVTATVSGRSTLPHHRGYGRRRAAPNALRSARHPLSYVVAGPRGSRPRSDFGRRGTLPSGGDIS